VLAALTIEAVVMGMMDVPEMPHGLVQRFDFWIAMAPSRGRSSCACGGDARRGAVVDLAISVATRRMPVLGRDPDTRFFRAGRARR
jgi:hypothetical protein